MVLDSEVLCSFPEATAKVLSPVAKKSKIQACDSPQKRLDWFCFSSLNSSIKNGRKSGCV